ncbi:hypothetical protein OV207_22700 [Corallococcus sp. BB11-1]|uniref:hypothetical protein n=1 Tax=Corallococcus sp. BB11-1 TaxID=2996783 RepID=UPI0010F03235|nr:hypothetical protein [Corallococcus sp. BB11-1]MCY1034283.1 hypothetical protein [Corallococcus sp. BB11-1]RYZ46931.1 MAG: hypothetical protein EOO72_00790 [Myxococcaceae bacterium]
MNLLRLSMMGLGVAFLVSGCGGSRINSKVDLSRMGPSMNAKRYANLEKIAATDLKCAEELTPDYLGENQYQMSGCGTEGIYELRCRMGQCSWVPDVRARAQLDLGCARAQLKTSRLDPVTVGVTGCGKRASYRALGSVYGLTWTLNSAVTEDAEAAATPTLE